MQSINQFNSLTTVFCLFSLPPPPLARLPEPGELISTISFSLEDMHAKMPFKIQAMSLQQGITFLSMNKACKWFNYEKMSANAWKMQMDQ